MNRRTSISHVASWRWFSDLWWDLVECPSLDDAKMADGIRDDIPEYRKRILRCFVTGDQGGSFASDIDEVVGDMRAAIPAFLTPQVIANVISALEQKALAGDVHAAEVLLKLAKDA